MRRNVPKLKFKAHTSLALWNFVVKARLYECRDCLIEALKLMLKNYDQCIMGQIHQKLPSLRHGTKVILELSY